ncbi:response regulator [Caballeronia sp. GAWG1-5s-s]|uniref:response regulator n=1 Tax=Caballeronia sp. GAWG1-5s-s TaxID=2921743 RepID=UPI0020287C34|nr:response regulator [Caballeronia sp. GAWG1-5s-s]
MVVDDNENGALALAAYLSLEGMDSRTAFGGRQAIEAATIWTPHVILMDVSMPECNGIEASRSLRRDPRTAGIAIIAFTALDEAEVRRQLRDSEFDGYLQKGVALGQMLELVRTFVQ